MKSELILWDVVGQHLSRAGLLYRQWRYALFSHRYDLDQIERELEGHIEVHLEGLEIAGQPAIDRLLFPAMEAPRDRDRATVAGLVLLASGGEDGWYELFELLAYADDEDQRMGLARAASLSDDPSAEALLKDAFQSSRSPILRAGLLQLLAIRHIDPGEALAECFELDLVPMKRAAISAAGRAGRRDLTPLVEGGLKSENPDLRLAAIEAGLALGSAEAWSCCRREARSRGPAGAEALLLVALLGTGDDASIIHERLEDEGMREAALWALGFTGKVESAERCRPLFRSPRERIAKLAAEAFSAITGFCGAGRDSLHAERSPEAVGGHGLDEVRHATDHLPLPDPDPLEAWWDAERDRFSKDERYLGGARRTPEALVEALRSAPMRRRHGLALELAIRTGSERVVETDAFAPRQRRQLQALAELRDEDFVNRFGDDR